MLQISVVNQKQSQQFSHEEGALFFGRCPNPPWIELKDDFVSREQVRIDMLSSTRLKVTNLSRHVPLFLRDGGQILPGTTSEISIPVTLTAGQTLIEIEEGMPEVEELMTISAPVRRDSSFFKVSGTGDFLANPSLRNTLSDSGLGALSNAPDTETLISWFETLVSVQRAAAGSHEFYQQTAQAVVELVGLDSGMIILREQDQWKVMAKFAAGNNAPSDFSRTLVQRVTEERRSFYRAAEVGSDVNSLKNVTAVVASPIFSSDSDHVVGVVYGTRFRGGLQIRTLEAQLVQVLAAAVGAGLARREMEAEASRRQVQFEQFFSSVLSNELDRDPALLVGKDRDVTVMFADIRNFSGLSEKLGARSTCTLVGSIMDRLTARIRDTEGVLVSYLGDGLLAMWNAPVEQHQHAVLACRAALAMMRELPAINAEWSGVVGAPIQIGIGINTGIAIVGNTGSSFKFNYGPLGHTVNLASRVEGATKQLGVPILITGAVQQRIGSAFATRRICCVRVVGIDEPVDLYELHSETSTEEWLATRDAYETALQLYESGNWGEACRVVYPLLSRDENQYDVPSLTLVGRSIDCLKFPPEDFDPVWELKNK